MAESLPLVDDYLARPISTMELVARVRSILRRTRPGLLAQLPAPSARIPAAGHGGMPFFEMLRGLLHSHPQRHIP